MFDDVEAKIKKKNKILFSRQSACLQDLIRQMDAQSHRTLVMWAFSCAQTTLDWFETKYPGEYRPRTALALCDQWASGKIKMPVAKRGILDAHAAAKDLDDPVYAALCHAIGHAGATVHIGAHALGLPLYELTAIVLDHGCENYQAAVFEKIQDYQQQLIYWQAHISSYEREWAGFLLRD